MGYHVCMSAAAVLFTGSAGHPCESEIHKQSEHRRASVIDSKYPLLPHMFLRHFLPPAFLAIIIGHVAQGRLLRGFSVLYWGGLCPWGYPCYGSQSMYLQSVQMLRTLAAAREIFAGLMGCCSGFKTPYCR